MLLEVRATEQGLELKLTGEWRALELAHIDAALATVDLSRARRVSITAGDLTALDLSGAWRLSEFVRQTRARGIEVSFRGGAPDQLELIERTLRSGAPPAPPVSEAEDIPLA